MKQDFHKHTMNKVIFQMDEFEPGQKEILVWVDENSKLQS